MSDEVSKNRKTRDPFSKRKEFLFVNLGSLLIAAGVYFFKIPNNLVIGGVSGIAVILSHFTPNLDATQYIFILNMVLLMIGFFFFGRKFGLKTVYASIMLSVYIEIFKLLPISLPLTDSRFLELMFAIILPGIGSGLLFNAKASSGGTDIVAMIMKKYTRLDIGKALLASDIIITLSTFFIYDAEIALSSLLGLMAKSIMVDSTLESVNRVKLFFIITEKDDIIIEFIANNLHRGGTKLVGNGIYSGMRKSMITVVCSTQEAVSLQQFLNEKDPNGFVSIVNTSQIIGRGFHYAS